MAVVDGDSGLSEGRLFGITADILAGESDIEDTQSDMDIPVEGIEEFFEVFLKIRFQIF